MKIYTKNGDSGFTSLISGKKLHKSEQIFSAIGALDELNAFLGLTHTIRNKLIRDMVLGIQNDLMIIGGILAGTKTTMDLQKNVNMIESYIDKLDEKLPTLKNFILPGGSIYAAYLHTARVICRRFERELLKVDFSNYTITKIELKNLIIYTNRLSDLLFMMARFINYKLGIKEKIWNNKH